MASCQSSPHPVEIPVPDGIHSVEKIGYSNTTETAVTEVQCPTLGANCHTGVVFGQSSLLFMLSAFSFKWQSQLSTQLSVSLLNN